MAIDKTHPSVLVLDNALDRNFYRPLEHWAALCGFEPDHVHVPSADRLPEPGAHSHVIISGSEDTITRLADWALAEAEWVATAIERGVRILGSCWGHQLIAVAVSGPDAVRRCSQPELGWLRIEVVEPDALFPPEGFGAFCSHFDEVLPGFHPEMNILARTADCAVHAFRLGEHPVWGIQAHPEIDPEPGRGFLEGGKERWPDHAERFDAALAGPVIDSRIGTRLVAKFLSI
jgi:GMP synthase (glutamine-hydrolysing)